MSSEHDETGPHGTGAADQSSTGATAFRCLFCGTPHGLKRAVERDDECSRCASPLFPAERHRLEYSGQRMLARIETRRLCRFYTTWPQREPFTAEMRDASLNGLQLATAVTLLENQIIKIDSDLCRALARVAHCRPDPLRDGQWAVGTEFLTLRLARTRGAFVTARA
jgi:hypothetical protein